MAGKIKRAAASDECPPSAMCAVCLEALHDTPRPTVSLSCAHTFHLDCIGNTWNAADEAGKCPMCRSEQPLNWRSGADFQATERAVLERETLELRRSFAGGQGSEMADYPSHQTIDEAAYDDVCRACGAGGELLLCEEPQCTCAMHLGCAGLSEVPRGEWHCPWCLVARHPQRRRFRGPLAAVPAPAVVTEFVPERRSARRRRAARRRELGLSAAVSALRRRRILRPDLAEPSSDGEEEQEDEGQPGDEQREEASTSTSRQQRQRRTRRRRCVASSDDEGGSDGHSSNSADASAARHQWSREEARERAAAAAESRQLTADGATDDRYRDDNDDAFKRSRAVTCSDGDAAWRNLTEEEKRTMAAMLCDTVGLNLDSTMPPGWRPVDDPADGMLLQRERKVDFIVHSYIRT